MANDKRAFENKFLSTLSRWWGKGNTFGYPIENSVQSIAFEAMGVNAGRSRLTPVINRVLDVGRGEPMFDVHYKRALVDDGSAGVPYLLSFKVESKNSGAITLTTGTSVDGYSVRGGNHIGAVLNMAWMGYPIHLVILHPASKDSKVESWKVTEVDASAAIREAARANGWDGVSRLTLADVPAARKGRSRGAPPVTAKEARREYRSRKTGEIREYSYKAIQINVGGCEEAGLLLRRETVNATGGWFKHDGTAYRVPKLEPAPIPGVKVKLIRAK